MSPGPPIRDVSDVPERIRTMPTPDPWALGAGVIDRCGTTVLFMLGSEGAPLIVPRMCNHLECDRCGPTRVQLMLDAAGAYFARAGVIYVDRLQQEELATATRGINRRGGDYLWVLVGGLEG